MIGEKDTRFNNSYWEYQVIGSGLSKQFLPCCSLFLFSKCLLLPFRIGIIGPIKKRCFIRSVTPEKSSKGPTVHRYITVRVYNTHMLRGDPVGSSDPEMGSEGIPCSSEKFWSEQSLLGLTGFQRIRRREWHNVVSIEILLTIQGSCCTVIYDRQLHLLNIFQQVLYILSHHIKKFSEYERRQRPFIPSPVTV